MWFSLAEFVCVFVCVCVCVCIHIYIYIYIHTHTHLHINVLVGKSVEERVKHVADYVCVCVCVYTYIHIYIYTHTHTSAYKRTRWQESGGAGQARCRCCPLRAPVWFSEFCSAWCSVS